MATSVIKNTSKRKTVKFLAKELKNIVIRFLKTTTGTVPEDPGLQQVHCFSEHEGVDLLLLHVRLHEEPESRHGTR